MRDPGQIFDIFPPGWGARQDTTRHCPACKLWSNYWYRDRQDGKTENNWADFHITNTGFGDQERLEIFPSRSTLISWLAALVPVMSWSVCSHKAQVDLGTWDHPVTLTTVSYTLTFHQVFSIKHSRRECPVPPSQCPTSAINAMVNIQVPPVSVFASHSMEFRTRKKLFLFLFLSLKSWLVFGKW